jgi:hypothetical protein
MEAPHVEEKKQERLIIERPEFNTTWTPVNPARLRSGAWVSLAKIFGEEKAHPIPLEIPNPPMSSFTVAATDIDISVAAKLSLGSIFSGSINYGDRAFYLDAVQYIEQYSENSGNPVVGTRWGVGLRVLLHVTNIKVNVNLNFSIVGSAVDLGYARAEYEIDGFGLEGGLQVVLGQLSGFGNLSAETYFRINNQVIPKLGQYMIDNPSKLKPVPFQVQLIQPVAIDKLLSARSIVFGMRRLRDGRSFNEAIAEAGGKYDKDEIKAVYMKLAPNTGANEKPPQSARDAADEWLADNRIERICV